MYQLLAVMNIKTRPKGINTLSIRIEIMVARYCNRVKTLYGHNLLFCAWNEYIARALLRIAPSVEELRGTVRKLRWTSSSSLYRSSDIGEFGDLRTQSARASNSYNTRLTTQQMLKTHSIS